MLSAKQGIKSGLLHPSWVLQATQLESSISHYPYTESLSSPSKDLIFHYGMKNKTNHRALASPASQTQPEILMANKAVKTQPDTEQSGISKPAYLVWSTAPLIIQEERGSWEHYFNCKKTGWLLINPKCCCADERIHGHRHPETRRKGSKPNQC